MTYRPQNSGADEYLNAQVLTASPERLHLLLVEAAIRFARQGCLALEERQFDKSYVAISRSHSCVAEMIAGVKNEPNAELAENLKALFAFIYKNLAYGDLYHEPQHVRDAIRILEIHRETWLELLERIAPRAAEIPAPHMTKAPEAARRSWVT